MTEFATPDDAKRFIDNKINEYLIGPKKRLCLCAVKNICESGTPGSIKYHHKQEYGLLYHTAEVIEVAIAMADVFSLPDMPKTGLLVACIFHDIDKLKRYVKIEKEHPDDGQMFIYNQALKNVNHTANSIDIYLSSCEHDDIVAWTDVVQLIMSHHGRAEWGALIEPQTLSADILHFADNMSSKYGPRR